MRIHIPIHLEKLEIISQLKKILIEYSKGGLTSDGTNSLDSYLYQRSLDPVRKFLIMCIPNNQNNQLDYNVLIDYYTNKFFSFRGTTKIFDILNEIKDVLNISITSYKYSVNGLDITFDKVSTSDINLFNKTISEFFSALLYYQEYVDIIKELNLNLTTEINSFISGGFVSFNELTVDGEYVNEV